MKVLKIDHIVITARDMDACLRFYQGLGFTVQKNGMQVSLLGTHCKINVHALSKELIPHAMYPTCGSMDVCFEVEDSLQVWKQRLEAQHITVEEGIVTRHGRFGQMASLYVRDPDGNLIELCSYHDDDISVAL